MLIPKSYRLLDDAIEEGCGFALNRVIDNIPLSKKDYDKFEGNRSQIVDAMINEVTIAIYERFEIPYPDDSQTPENMLKSACIQARSLVGRIITRYLKKRGGMGDSRGGDW